MIQRDRNMQRLGLHCVEELPKPGVCMGDRPSGEDPTNLAALTYLIVCKAAKGKPAMSSCTVF